jgi:hypothetical protein
MANLNVQPIALEGLDPVYSAADSNGDSFRPGGRVFIHVINSSGSSVTVTVDDALTVAPRGARAFDPDVDVVVEPSGERFIGPVAPERFRGENGDVEVSYSDVTGLEVAALRL